MAAYFRQLAERALRPASTLHSTAALPYSPAPEPPPEALQAQAASGSEPNEPAPIGEQRQAPRPRGNASPLTAASLPAMDLEVRREVRPKARKKKGRPPRVAATPPSRAAKPPRGRAPDPRSVPLQVPDRVDPARALKPVIANAEALPSKQPPARPQPSPTRRPAAVATRTARSTLRRKPATPARRATEPPPPEVHIHIGRVELTAPAPSTTPRPAPSADRKPMSLDEYLRHRRAGNGADMP